MENKFLDKVFEELKYLNKVPKFQLERAVSPLLGIFIKQIINKLFTTYVSEPIPEFPLKKKGNTQSTNVDWLLFDDNKKTIYCVELKTDKFSYNSGQSKIYRATKSRVEEKGAGFLLKDLKVIKSKSKRPDKYDIVIKNFPIKKDALNKFRNLIVIYLAPVSPPDTSKIYCDKLILFSKLPDELDGEYSSEWLQLRSFLIDLNSQQSKKKNCLPEKQQEGNVAIFKDLGIYSEDPEEDRKINENLIEFLKSIGHPPAEIVIK